MIHSFLMIGQSNMAGRGCMDDVSRIENPDLFMLRNGRWQPMCPPVNPDRPFSGISLAESFADAYQKEHGVRVGLIPCADGGTQIAQWKKGSLLFDHAVMMAKLASRTSCIAGILWHQGESDCKEGLSETYGEKLETFYRDLTEETGLSDVPFIAGGLGDFLELREPERYFAGSVNRQIREFAQCHAMTGFVSAKGLTGKPDHLHFDAVSQREFGLRYYAVFRELEPKDRIFEEKICEDDTLRTEIDGL